MPIYDVVIIGGGPAGLTAGLYLSQARRKAIVLEKEVFGGPIMNLEWIENYPGFANGVSGAQLASEMVTQVTNFGLELRRAEVVGVEFRKTHRTIRCGDGEGYSATVVIIATGARHKKLGVPGEEKLQGKGLFNCALCDGRKFRDQVVAVCGGGDAGVTEALYMTKLASKVILIEAMPDLTARAILRERVLANPKLEIHCGTRVEAVIGNNHVEAVELLQVKTGQKKILEVGGVLVHIGLEPNAAYLKGAVPLDSQGYIVVDNAMRTKTTCVLAAGDIRSGSPRQIISAAGDGAIAAIGAEGLLQELA